MNIWLFEFPDHEYRYSILTKTGNKYMCDVRGNGYRYGNLLTDFNPLDPLSKDEQRQVALDKKIADLLEAWRDNGGIEYKTLADLPLAVVRYCKTLR
jgi:hypothetical protein